VADHPSSYLHLGARERQIMEVVYQRGEASVADVLGAIPDPPSYSAVRTMMRLLEEKGHLRHKEAGRKFVYMPVVAPERARRSAVRNLLATFFDGSVTNAVASLIDIEKGKLSDDDLDRLAKLIDRAKKEGR
jgi:predicted transcriptional regulator